ncbi:AAA family ATPase [Paraliobacillus sp. JSM ZJ581]|uniref:AAA family ATPase n=1 Tax=Paraliobacillus sp. JSM ZJ581 TaxID=3342118 RepID=UPI0035A82EDA
MKFILLFGPQAVGKMTIGHELEKLTAFKLFHNHMTIELVQPFFDFGTPGFERLVNLFRNEIFTEVAHSDLPGFIFTYVWAFNEQEDWDFVQHSTSIFEKAGATIYYVELEADVEERLKRNITPNRLTHKATKRNTEQSEAELLRTMKTYRLNSFQNEITAENYIRIDNTNLTAQEVALKIKEAFQF